MRKLKKKEKPAEMDLTKEEGLVKLFFSVIRRFINELGRQPSALEVCAIVKIVLAAGPKVYPQKVLELALDQLKIEIPKPTALERSEQRFDKVGKEIDRMIKEATRRQ